MRAHQIMTRKVISVRPDDFVVDAANTMLQQHISGLPVVSETGKLVGIISEGDFIRRAEIGTQRNRGRWLRLLIGPGRAATDYVHEQGRKVGEIMTPDPLTVQEDHVRRYRQGDGKEPCQTSSRIAWDATGRDSDARQSSSGGRRPSSRCT
jgi:CBS domain-containing protein